MTFLPLVLPSKVLPMVCSNLIDRVLESVCVLLCKLNLLMSF